MIFAVILPGANLPGVFVLLPVALLLGLGYSAPPLRLAYHTCGEVVVAFTHSVLLVVLGHVSQGGGMTLQPWLFSLPMFFAILPSITLAGFPDKEADAAHGKKTLVVRFGHTVALKIAMAAVIIAGALRTLLLTNPLWLWIAIVVHGTILLFALVGFYRRPSSGRINGMLALALAYMFWFAWPS